MAGQIFSIARGPQNAQITQNGTMSEKNGNWRPTIAPSVIGLSPVVAPSTTIGVPSAP